MRFDDQLWDHVWERNLSHVERHTIAMAVWRRRAPDTRFEHMIAVELCRRWRRHVVYLVGLYGLWTLFWGGIAATAPPAGAEPTTLPAACVAVGLTVIAGCLAFRRHLAGYLRTHGAVAPVASGVSGPGGGALGGAPRRTEGGIAH